MIVDGKKLAIELLAELRKRTAARKHAPHFTIFTCAPNFETQKYLLLKKKRASEVGIGVNVIEFPEHITTEEMIQTVEHAQMQTDGIIVQLPLPPHIDTQSVLNSIPAKLDVDGMHYDGTDLTQIPPVVGAIDAIAKAHDVLFATQQVVVLGYGRLVGKPAAIWAQRNGANVTILTKESSQEEIAEVLMGADILILGAGHAGFIKPEMIREGVIIFDAGTSEEGGELKGDADPNCAKKSSIFTPVPGGIGPLTIACLLQNVLKATKTSADFS